MRLHEKGGKRHALPCHHNLEAWLLAYIEGAGLASDPKGPLFRTVGRGTGELARTPLPQANAYAMVRRRAAAAGIATRIGNHSFRATARDDAIRQALATTGRARKGELSRFVEDAMRSRITEVEAAKRANAGRTEAEIAAAVDEALEWARRA